MKSLKDRIKEEFAKDEKSLKTRMQKETVKKTEITTDNTPTNPILTK